jgi:arylsulfatase A-like enzyme
MRTILLLALIVCYTISCNITHPERPNIIIINVDDMGWRDTGFMGSQFYETPHIDSLASIGMIFNNGYATAANCAPSRACLMTGLWTPRHGIYTVGSSERGKSNDRRLVPVTNNQTLDLSHTTLPEVLKDRGYTTIHAGKWHISDDPRQFGFDHNIGGGHNGHPRSYFYPYGNVDLPGAAGDHLTSQIMDRVIDSIKDADSPFFLHYAPYAVHTPIQPIPGLKEKYMNKPHWRSQFNIDYATMVENLDLNIGRLVSTLNEIGVMDQTLLVFTSDNGGLYGVTYQYPLRAGKGSYYEGGIRVPFFIVWNKHIKAAGENNTPITNLDLFPTLMEAAGIDIGTYQYDGVSLIPFLTGSGQLPERPLFWHFPIYLQAYNPSHNQNRDSLFRTRPGSVIRMGDWKLHHYFEDDGLELYNIKDDIGEQSNLVQQNPMKRDELFSLLDQWRQQVNAPVPDQLNPDYKIKTPD